MSRPHDAAQAGPPGPGHRRHPAVPEDWAEILDPAEWRLGPDGLPFRRAARVLALTAQGQVLLMEGHDVADPEHRWIFTPGGGLQPDEEAAAGAVRELAEETGLRVEPGDLEGPIAQRDAVFRFARVVCRQHESLFLLRLPAATDLDAAGWTALEREAVDSMRWWGAADLERAGQEGREIYPVALPGLVAELAAGGWDGGVRDLTDPADARDLAGPAGGHDETAMRQ